MRTELKIQQLKKIIIPYLGWILERAKEQVAESWKLAARFTLNDLR